MKVEQAYAPPFSSAKDPVALAGYVAEDIITGKNNPVYWRELRDIEMENKFLLDVRTPDEFSLGSLPGAVNIPLDELRDRLAELPKDKMIYTFCAVGLRGYLAYRILTQHGFDKVRNLSGGLKTYPGCHYSHHHTGRKWKRNRRITHTKGNRFPNQSTQRFYSSHHCCS